MKNQLKPCKCGNPVKIKYIIGFGGGLEKLVNNQFAGNMPAYYINCENCGEHLCIRLTILTVQYRDKCKRELIKSWNKKSEVLEVN